MIGPKFAIGARVTVTRATLGDDCEVGQIGTVLDKSKSPWVCFDSKTTYRGSHDNEPGSRAGFEVEDVINAAKPKWYVIGYGESDIPQVMHCSSREDVYNALRELQFGDPSRFIHDEEDGQMLEEQMKSFDDPGHWHQGVHHIRFEIGAISIYQGACA